MNKKNELALDLQTTELAPVENLQTSTELAPASLYEDFSDLSHENIGFDDVKFPEILLVQDNSKFLLKKYKEAGIKPGDFFNNVENTFSPTLNVIPFYIAKYYDVRIPKDNSDVSKIKIFELPKTAQKVPESSYWIDPNFDFEHKIYETFCYLVLLENMTFAKIIFQKSRHKMALKWNTLIKSRGLNAFKYKYRLHAFEDTHKGNTWLNIDMTCLEELDPKTFNQVGQLARAVTPHVSSFIMAEDLLLEA